MDLLRSIIKVHFYDFAPEWVAESLKLDIEECDTHFFDRSMECMKWREQRFTLSELNILKSWMVDELLNDNDVGFGKNKDTDAVYTAYERVFIPLCKCGTELLDLTSTQPQVKYRHLLRWRDLTLLVGENLLTLAAIARHDLMCGIERKIFTWSNVLLHNELKLNGILSRTLSDTHAHLNASTDVFDINWIVVMNHPQILASLRDTKYKGIFTCHGPHQEYDTVSRHSDIKLSLPEWIELAATLRIRLLMLLIHINESVCVDTEINFEDVNLMDMLRNEFLGTYSYLSDHIVKTHNGVKFDYAILEWEEFGIDFPSEEDVVKSPFMILHGERSLIYNYFKHYFNGNETIRRFAPQLYLYFTIKNKVRRELIQTNSLIGFGNFKAYQDLKLMFVGLLGEKDRNLKNLYKDIALSYAIQSAIVGTNPNYFEARVMPMEVDKLKNFNYRKAIFGKGNAFEHGKAPLVTLVAHFAKLPCPPDKPEGEIRHKKLRKDISKHTDRLISSF